MRRDTLPSELDSVSFLIGTWRGRGRGDYPTIDPFEYLEEISFMPLPKPVLAYQQRTRHATTEEPLHAEAGFVRMADGAPELVISQPTGIVEAHRGSLHDQSVVWDSHHVAATPSAEGHRVTAVRRALQVRGDTLSYVLWMAAAGHPLQPHLRAELRRVDG